MCVPIALAPAAADEGASCAAAAPLRIVNLNPFHLPYRAPASLGACVLAPGASEVIASLDIASHMVGARSRAELLSIDGETWRPELALRRGFREGWEYFLELSSVSHVPGAFDGFIETWHSVFGLPQGGRDSTPRGRLGIVYARDGVRRVDIDRETSSPGDLALGIGHAARPDFLANDGLAIRGAVSLPTGSEAALTGTGGLSAAVWAETSGVLLRPGGGRAWLYGAALGALAASPPEALSGIAAGRFAAFGRLSVTWRALPRLSLTAQVDLRSSPYGRSSLAPLAGPIIMLGMGGRIELTPHTTLEVAVVEDDGWRRAAPDIGLHAALRWRP